MYVHTNAISNINKFIWNEKVSIMSWSRNRHGQTIHVKGSSYNCEYWYALKSTNEQMYTNEQHKSTNEQKSDRELTNEKTAASIEPRWILKYLLLCNKGFWYHGIFTDFMDRDFCECKFDNDLKIITFYWPKIITKIENWITVLLNGSTPLIECMMWLAFSFHTFWRRFLYWNDWMRSETNVLITTTKTTQIPLKIRCELRNIVCINQFNVDDKSNIRK